MSAVVMLPAEVTVTAPLPVLRAKIPLLMPAVVMLPVEVTVTAPALWAKIPYAPTPAVVMPKVPVSLVMVTAPLR